MSHEKKKSQHYVNNQKLAEEISKYREALDKAQKEGKPEPRIPDYIGKCIWDIAEKLSTKPCFINYSFRDEMVSDGIENCFLYFRDYNPEYVSDIMKAKGQGPNPFAYFTQIIYYAFIRRINKEEKNRYILYKNFNETLSHVDPALLADGDNREIIPSQMYENINIFMKKFEEKEKRKKLKRKSGKKEE